MEVYGRASWRHPISPKGEGNSIFHPRLSNYQRSDNQDSEPSSSCHKHRGNCLHKRWTRRSLMTVIYWSGEIGDGKNHTRTRGTSASLIFHLDCLRSSILVREYFLWGVWYNLHLWELLQKPSKWMNERTGALQLYIPGIYPSWYLSMRVPERVGKTLFGWYQRRRIALSGMTRAMSGKISMRKSEWS